MSDEQIRAMVLMNMNLHLLTLERTGWRRWVFGRWVYSSEPFRHDIARAIKHCEFIHARNQRRLA